MAATATVQREVIVDKDVAKRKVKASALCYTPPAMINDKKRDRSYFRRGLLGEGGFARCFEVTDFQGTRLAAKCIAKKSIVSDKVKMKLLGEIKVHKSMDHPNIVRQRDCFEDDVNVYMILDICTNGTLMEMLRYRKRFTEPEVRFFGIQILGAAKYMHSRRVIHRDLKLGNLFLDDDMNIKVGDFGLAALLVDENDRKKTICGTPNYIAPEVLFGSAEGHSYEVDLWSIGIILYAMLIGKPPFQSKDVKAIYAKIKTNEYEFPETCDISEHAKDLIASLLSTDPENRPSIDDLARHLFFNTGYMPRSIPSTAVKVMPDFPAAQSASMFRRNQTIVFVKAGIGLGQSAGREQGKAVDIVVEKPDGNRYLPVSLSPRTGPTAKIIDLQVERAGGRSTLADRLNSVKLDDAKQDESKARDLRRTTLGAGALRAQMKENVDPRSTAKAASAREPSRSTLTGLRPSRVASDSSRPITRSSRFHAHNELEEGLGLPRRAISAADRVPSRSSSRTTSRAAESPEPRSSTSSRPSSRASTKPVYDRARRVSQYLEAALRAQFPSDSIDLTNLVYIQKWVDYSHRYGLGYQLSNDSTGVYFNDTTSIIVPSNSSEFTFISSSATKHTIEHPPKELGKKVYLLKHFRTYMTTHLSASAATTKKGLDTHLTHYFRANEGILFRLSDGTIQINFTDHSKLMLPCEPGVRFVHEKEVFEYSLAEAVDSPHCREKIESAIAMINDFLESVK